MNVQKIKCGDLVEYMGNGYPSRNKFGIVFHIKKLTRHYEVGVLFGVRKFICLLSIWRNDEIR